jgi:hypothetical protein
LLEEGGEPAAEDFEGYGAGGAEAGVTRFEVCEGGDFA